MKEDYDESFTSKEIEIIEQMIELSISKKKLRSENELINILG